MDLQAETVNHMKNPLLPQKDERGEGNEPTPGDSKDASKFMMNGDKHQGACIRWYWVKQKLPQICTENHATFRIRIRIITVQICGNYWVTQSLRTCSYHL